MEKKKVTLQVVERINHLCSQYDIVAADKSSNRLGELEAIYTELHNLRKEYDLFDKVFEDNGKKGVVDIAGRVLVPAMYDGVSEIYPYCAGERRPVAVSDHSGKFALVKCDGTGVPLCNFEYDEVKVLWGSAAYYLCGKMNSDGKMLYGVIDSVGKELVPCEMDSVDPMLNGYSLLYADDKIGALSIDGKYIKPQFDELENSDIDSLWGRKGDVSGFIDDNGEFFDE